MLGVATVVWGTFMILQAPAQLPAFLSLVPQVRIFGSAAAGLAVTCHRTVALVFEVIVVRITALLSHVWGHRRIAS